MLPVVYRLWASLRLGHLQEWVEGWRLGLPGRFRRVYFSFHSQNRLRFKLAAGLGEPWCRDGGIPSGLSAKYGVYCGPVCPVVSSS